MSRLASSAPIIAETPEPQPRSIPALVLSLMSVAKSVRQLMSLKLAALDVAVGQDQLLEVLDPDRTTSVGMLADRLAVRPSTVSKMLDRLIDKGWVEREASSTDKRTTMVRLTPLGSHVQRMVRDVWRDLEADLVKTLGDADAVASVISEMQRADDLVSKRLSRLR